MSPHWYLFRLANRLLSKANFELVYKPAAKLGGDSAFRVNRELSKSAADYLTPENPRLKELQEAYAKHFGRAHSRWDKDYISKEVDLQYFRGDTAYVWQLRDGNTEVNYALTTYYVQTIDELGLLNKLTEDNEFGALTYAFDDATTVSRDLLDSIIEISFLEKHLKLSQMEGLKVLDIGAGYGRFAHRLAQSLGNLDHIYCTDAIPESTYLAEFYLKYRGMNNAGVAPVHEIENMLAGEKITLASNIHSFSECSIDSIRWWLDLVKKNNIPYLFIVPNAGSELNSREADNSHVDYRPELEQRGYKQIVREPKFANASVQKHGISPTEYYIFKLEN